MKESIFLDGISKITSLNIAQELDSINKIICNSLLDRMDGICLIFMMLTYSLSKAIIIYFICTN